MHGEECSPIEPEVRKKKVLYHYFYLKRRQHMRKSMFVTLVMILFSGLTAATASAALPMVCLRLQHGLVGIQPFVFKLSVEDMSNGNFSVVGSSFTTSVTNPPTTVRRVLSGGAVIMEADKVEVSLRATDIFDFPATGVVESLAVSDIHMLLNSNLNGTFHIVNVQYPVSSAPAGIVTTSHEGTVSLVACN
jgi:hypothetical protein